MGRGGNRRHPHTGPPAAAFGGPAAERHQPSPAGGAATVRRVGDRLRFRWRRKCLDGWVVGWRLFLEWWGFFPGWRGVVIGCRRRGILPGWWRLFLGWWRLVLGCWRLFLGWWGFFLEWRWPFLGCQRRGLVIGCRRRGVVIGCRWRGILIGWRRFRR
jgi:hypothetical protein